MGFIEKAERIIDARLDGEKIKEKIRKETKKKVIKELGYSYNPLLFDNFEERLERNMCDLYALFSSFCQRRSGNSEVSGNAGGFLMGIKYFGSNESLEVLVATSGGYLDLTMFPERKQFFGRKKTDKYMIKSSFALGGPFIPTIRTYGNNLIGVVKLKEELEKCYRLLLKDLEEATSLDAPLKEKGCLFEKCWKLVEILKELPAHADGIYRKNNEEMSRTLEKLSR
jgi:hypothetical protein